MNHWKFLEVSVLGQFIFLLISEKTLENIPNRDVRLLHITVHVSTNLICHWENNTKFLTSASAQLHSSYSAEYCARACYDTPILSP